MMEQWNDGKLGTFVPHLFEKKNTVQLYEVNIL
jgi:hypothetical protein